MPLINIDIQPEDKRFEEAMKLAEEEVRTPFKLEEPGLVRFKVLRLGEDDHILVMTIHHIIADAWSIEVFLNEMLTFYSAAVEGRVARLPELQMQYVDFAYQQQKWLKSEEATKQLEFWKQHLSGSLKLLNLPISNERSRNHNYKGGRKTVKISKDTTIKLKSICQRERSTLFMVMMAVFNTWIYRYSRVIVREKMKRS